MLKNPPVAVQQQLETLFPLAIQYARDTQTDGLEKGVPLVDREIAIAGELGVTEPRRVRVVYTETLPFPTDPILITAAKRHGYQSTAKSAYTFGHAIYIKNSSEGNTRLMAHELVHVRQFERLGLEELTRRYLLELVIMGYRAAPLEREARDAASKYHY